MKKLGLRIKFLRMSKDINQSELAALVKTFENNMSNIETGKVNISMKTLVKIANALDVEPYKLLEFKD
ncbi:MAG: helix-turn-helix transcriptional regulator [Candidatus Gastranaerophilaceae bacterium]